ncbi:MAG: cytidylate kinase family protein [Planctomycetes bacterium]|jgi:cytidylate kinase|nr:cytidylate kinase family protein [Planctomycetota bacterium]
MIISISGSHGSGKSTLAQQLAEALKWPRYYMGGLRREAAKKRGLTLAEYNKLGETDPTTDLEVDKYQEELGKKEDNFIIEGRTSWYFIPHSLKIYLDVSPEVGAKRILKETKDTKNNNLRKNEDNNLKTIEEIQKSLKTRYKSDRLRYKKYFNIDVYNKKHYDFVLDTSNLNKRQVFNKIYQFVKQIIDKR